MVASSLLSELANLEKPCNDRKQIHTKTSHEGNSM